MPSRVRGWANAGAIACLVLLCAAADAWPIWALLALLAGVALGAWLGGWFTPAA